MQLLRFVISILVAAAVMGPAAPGALGWNMRRISNAEGLTSAAILSLHQDTGGMLWVGTCDGVCLYDGLTVYPLAEVYPASPLSGNIIEGIGEGRPGEMWIRTNYALDRLDTRTGQLKAYNQFHGNEILRKDGKNNIYVLAEDGTLFRHNPDSDEFMAIEGFRTNRDEVFEIGFVADRVLLFGRDGITSVGLTADGRHASAPAVVSDDPLQFAIMAGRDILSVNGDGMLRRFNTQLFANDTVTSLAPLIAERGEVSSLCVDRDDDVFVSFKTHGAIRADRVTGYRPVDIGIGVGVFSLLASPTQDVVWIGSDCSGVYTCFKAGQEVETISFGDLGGIISNPVRSVWLDPDRNLWLGTKGDGLLRLGGFDTRTGSFDTVGLLTSGNSPLCHNSVFALAGSARPRMWVGTDEGVNLYDYRTHRLHAVDCDTTLHWVHGLYEQGDSVLWIATVGAGVFRAAIDNRGAVPRLRDIRQYLVGDRTVSNNYFFAATSTSDGRPLFANRGMGAFVYDAAADSLQPLPLRRDYGINAVNDVFTVIRNDSVMWLGTGHGLLRQTPADEQLYVGVDNGFANNTIHAMLTDASGDLWISTNNGLVRLNPATGRTQLLDRNMGVAVTEFSDGASLVTADSLLIFGGTDGVALIRSDLAFGSTDTTIPRPSLIGLTIEGNNAGFTDYYSPDDNRLTLSYDQNYITLTFSSPDHANAHAISYMYSLDGRDWIDNGSDNRLSFTDMRPGTHTLYVKCLNRVTNLSGEPLALNMHITPPWYLSTPAKVVYVLLAIALVALAVLYLLYRQRREQRRTLADMEQTHKEEVYEEKLKFFTNITHEFCTPLTLIAGPCERILSYEKADSFVRRYVSLIYTNTQRLNNLIQEIIDFRRIETGHNLRKVRHIDMSELCNDTINSFADLAERSGITVVNQVEPGISWNTDYRSISKIITNLISNAFKYTHTGGTIRVALGQERDHLRLMVWNTGKGISEEDKAKVFNHYAILDNVEENATRGLTARNGLGMAICHTMVELLEGTIEIESEVGSYASFIVRLPRLEVDPDDDGATPVPMPGRQPAAPVDDLPVIRPDEPEPAMPTASGGPTRHRLLIVDDNEEMLTLLADSLQEYDITTATDGGRAIELLTQSVFDLVITDVMMPGTDGLELTRQIKANRHTSHLPLIILSARVSNEEMIRGIESGADVYIRKPFSFSYLRAMIVRLIEHNRQLRDYYNSSGSAYQYDGGQLVSREDKEFVDRAIAFIDSNIDDCDLTIEAVARHLNMSSRNLYRKLKDLGLSSPNDFIKEHRLSTAARLLRTTTVTVQEIIFRIGFSNRSHFYREFAKRYQMTPKEYRTANQTRDDSLGKN